MSAKILLELVSFVRNAMRPESELPKNSILRRGSERENMRSLVTLLDTLRLLVTVVPSDAVPLVLMLPDPASRECTDSGTPGMIYFDPS